MLLGMICPTSVTSPGAMAWRWVVTMAGIVQEWHPSVYRQFIKATHAARRSMTKHRRLYQRRDAISRGQRPTSQQDRISLITQPFCQIHLMGYFIKSLLEILNKPYFLLHFIIFKMNIILHESRMLQIIEDLTNHLEVFYISGYLDKDTLSMKLTSQLKASALLLVFPGWYLTV